MSMKAKYEARIAEVQTFLSRPPARGNHEGSSMDRADLRIAAELAVELYEELLAMESKGRKRNG